MCPGRVRTARASRLRLLGLLIVITPGVTACPRHHSESGSRSGSGQTITSPRLSSESTGGSAGGGIPGVSEFATTSPPDDGGIPGVSVTATTPPPAGTGVSGGSENAPPTP